MGAAILILLLLVLCGFIAYMGDLLGRRLGKKRLSVFGLRPKHTAILLTVVTGVVIAAVTFGIAVISVPGFRNVVTQGERLTAQNARLSGVNRNLEAAIGQRTQQNEALEGQNQRLAGDNARLVKQNQTLETGNQALAAKNRALNAKNQALAGQNSTLQSANSSLAGKNSTLVRESTKLAATNARLGTQQTRLRAESTALKSDIRRLGAEIASLRKLENHLRTEQYLYRRGQQIAQRIIPANPPPDVLRNTVRAVIFEATGEVDGKEAIDGHQWVKPKDYPAGRPDKVEAIQEWVAARAMQARGDDLAFRVVAAANCVAGEKVPLRLDWYVNDRVFRKDEVLGSRLVDGAAEEGDILNELVILLKTQVGPAALRKDMAPDADDTFGALTYNQLLPVCRKIKAINGFVKVVAL
ncbi:MAG: DUF3084 domain-containing protein, partial [Actinomycetota bacterium]